MIATHLNTMESVPVPSEADQALRPMDPVIEAALTENHRAFLGFLIRRLGDEGAAEDVHQSFCLRVINSSNTELRNSQSVIAWLYAVLRSALTDYYRSEAVRKRRDASYAQEQIVLGNDREEIELEDSLCNCFRGLLPTLRPDYAEVLRRIDFLSEPHNEVARDLGITPANVRVRLFRARQALRKSLTSCCGQCCEQDYRDCTCGNVDGHSKNHAN